MSESGPLPDWLKRLYPFPSRFLQTAQGRMHYVDVGSGAETVLMVHGNPTWSFLYRRLALGLSPQRRCVIPDHLGCGLSDRPAGCSYRLAAHIANLESLILSLDLRQVTLVVHDWGGPIGLGVALRHPERFNRIIISNTAAFPDARLPWRIALCRTPGLGSLLVRGANVFAGLAPRMGSTRGLPREVARAYRYPYRSWRARVAVDAFVRDIPMRPEHPTYALLAEIGGGLHQLQHLPALLVWGDRDFCFSPHFRSRWERVFPNAGVRAFAEAGHLVWEDAAEEALAAVNEFLEGPLRDGGRESATGRKDSPAL